MNETKPFIVAEIPQHLHVSTDDGGAWADIWLTQLDDNKLEAQSYMEAPKRGDEVITMVAEKLQQIADELNTTIKHIITASNKGARALAERTKGYEYIGEDAKGNGLFTKIYAPKI